MKTVLKRKTWLYLCLIVIVPIQVLFAKPTGWIDLGVAKVSFDLPKSWKKFEKVMGLPLLFTSPQVKGARITVSVTPSDVKDFGFKDTDFSKNEFTFKEDALRWLATKEGKVREFFPYKKEEWSSDTIAHIYGWKYDLGGTTFIERSMYVLCQKQVFHIKTMYKEQFNAKDQPKIDKFLKSFKCQPGANL